MTAAYGKHDIERLEAEIARLNDRIRQDAEKALSAFNEIDRMQIDNNDLRAKIERLQAFGREYADHRPNCRVGDGMYCTCGYLSKMKAT
jgi:hypothetical protein